MTPDERREVVATFRAEAAYCAERADAWNKQRKVTTEWARKQAWEMAARANLLTLAANEIERKGDDDAR